MGLNVPVELGGHGLGMGALIAISEVSLPKAPPRRSATPCTAWAPPSLRPRPRSPAAGLPGTHRAGAPHHHPRPERARQRQPISTSRHRACTGRRRLPGDGHQELRHQRRPRRLLRDVHRGCRGRQPARAPSAACWWTGIRRAWIGRTPGRASACAATAPVTVRLEGCARTPPNLLGEEGDQLWYMFEVVAPYFLIAMAGTYGGVAWRARHRPGAPGHAPPCPHRASSWARSPSSPTAWATCGSRWNGPAS
jgi:hypothetical protein